MITIPKLKNLYNAIIADLESALSITIPAFGKNFLRALAGVLAGALKLLYLALGNVQRNTWPDTADSEADGGTLERFGRSKLGRNPDPAISGIYQVSVTGTSDVIIKRSTTFKSDDNSTSPGELFILDNDFTLVTGFDIIPLRALTPGTISKLAIGDALTATQPMAQVESGVLVQSISTQPIDAEDLEAYRLKIENSFRLEAQGGAGSDYVLWSQDAPGVAKVYPYAKSGVANEINLFVEAIYSDSEDGEGTPTQSILDAVKAVVEFDPDATKPLLQRGRKPLTVKVNYLPVTINEVYITITGSNFTDDEKSIISDAVKEFISTVRPFIASTDILENKNDILNMNQIINVILTAIPGAIFNGVIMQVDNEIKVSHHFINGNIPFLNIPLVFTP